MGWKQSILIVLVGIGAVRATEPHCTTEGRFANPDDCGSFYDCLPSENGGYDLIQDDCKGFRYDSTSRMCSSETCATRERRSVMTPYHAYSHLCEEMLNGFVCADCRSLVLCVKGQAFVRRCTADRFCDMREDFGGGVCYPKSPLQCTCLEAHTFFRDYYDSQKFFSCSGVGSSPTSYRCPDGMFFSEETSQCRSKESLPPCTVPGIFANPKNCTEYYSCIALRYGWLQKSFACLNGFLYNENTGICEDPCPQAVCTKEGRFPDPLDKSCYYECFLDGEKMKSIRYQCPEGNVWHEDEGQSGHCVLETEIEVPSPFAKCENQLDMCKDDIIIVEPPIIGCASNPCYPGVPCEHIAMYPFYTCGRCPPDIKGDGVSCHNLMCPHKMAGDGILCGLDTDEDGYPDHELNCPYVKCRRDNCEEVYNPDQHDLDEDGIGDKCDYDIDGDGVANVLDNCPYTWSPDQGDTDNDRVGNICDNCPNLPNPHQEDDDQDFVGNVCDNDIDYDSDGIQDNLDNCPTAPNADQSDADKDAKGDVCDADADNDGIPNTEDNCVLVYNPDQKNTSPLVLGDACIYDFDGDGVPDKEDHCSSNPSIQKIKFKNATFIDLLPDRGFWELGTGSITQKNNAAASMVIGETSVSGMDFTGNFRVESPWTNYIGLIFSYQSNRKFYIFMWKNETTDDLTSQGVQLKVVDSLTGPSEQLSDALWKMKDTVNQTRLIWQEKVEFGTSKTYKWLIQHRPTESSIRVKIYQDYHLVLDSGVILDDTLKGGRVGVFSHSQMGVRFSNYELMCNNGRMEYHIELPTLTGMERYIDIASSNETVSDGDTLPYSEMNGRDLLQSPEEELESPLINPRSRGRVSSWAKDKYSRTKRLPEVIKWMLKQPVNAEKVFSKLEELYPGAYKHIRDLPIWKKGPENVKSVIAELRKRLSIRATIRIQDVGVVQMESAPTQRKIPDLGTAVSGAVKLPEGGENGVENVENIPGKVGGTLKSKLDSSQDEKKVENPAGKPSETRTHHWSPTSRRTSKWG